MALILRTCGVHGESSNGFVWPKSGIVEAPDWLSNPVCGNGLHGLLWGEGDGELLNWRNDDAAWVVAEVADDAIVRIDNSKVKFPRAEVIYFGDRKSATELIYSRAPQGVAVVGIALAGGYRSTLTGGYRSTLTGGDESTLTGGYRSTLTGGYRSTLTGGNESTLTGGYRSTLTGGYRSTLTGGDESTLTGGYRSTLTGGDESTLTGGNRSTLTGGYRSTLTGGDESTLTGGGESTLTGGNRSTLTGGNRSTLTGGDESTLVFRYGDGKRCRSVVGCVGEDGIEPNVAYHLNNNHEIVRQVNA